MRTAIEIFSFRNQLNFCRKKFKENESSNYEKKENVFAQLLTRLSGVNSIKSIVFLLVPFKFLPLTFCTLSFAIRCSVSAVVRWNAIFVYVQQASIRHLAIYLHHSNMAGRWLHSFYNDTPTCHKLNHLKSITSKLPLSGMAGSKRDMRGLTVLLCSVAGNSRWSPENETT